MDNHCLWTFYLPPPIPPHPEDAGGAGGSAVQRGGGVPALRGLLPGQAHLLQRPGHALRAQPGCGEDGQTVQPLPRLPAKVSALLSG